MDTNLIDERFEEIERGIRLMWKEIKGIEEDLQMEEDEEVTEKADEEEPKIKPRQKIKDE